MRLSCETHLSYRKGGPGRRLGQSTLTISPNLRNNNEFNLVITTRQNATGVTYKNVKHNVLKLFTSCVRQGKLTISMREPEHDILIKNANTNQLENFLKVLQAAVKGLTLPKKFTSQPPTKVEPKIKKLVISQRSEYPIKGFPKELEQLKIENINLSRIQNNICVLSNLTELSIDNNSLEEIPKALATTRLVSLSLQGNKISQVNDIFSKSLGLTLKSLNLSHNQIVRLPYSLCRTKLHRLDLSHNRIESLPPSFSGGDQMKTLKLNDNQLRRLPAPLHVKSAELTIRGNAVLFEDTEVQPARISLEPMTLLYLAGRVINNCWPLQRVTIDDSIPRTLYAYLLSFVACGACGKLTFPSPNRRSVRRVHILELAGSIVAEAGDPEVVAKDDIRCSIACAD